MDQALKLHIRHLQRRALAGLAAVLAAVIALILGIMLLFSRSYWAIAFLLATALCIVYLAAADRRAKNEPARGPVVFDSGKDLSFPEITGILETLARDHLSISEDVHFYRLQKGFKLRVILYKAEAFSKKDFDSAKNRMNKKANRELSISQWVSRSEAHKMMRFNIICADTVNEALHQLLCQNANHNLTRVEGIINIAAVGNQVMLPPLYGNCQHAEIRRYKGVIQFINRILLQNQ